MGRKPCCSKNGVKKGVWTTSEDKMLTDYVTVHGDGKWRDIPKLSGLQRCGKSCRLRWLNYLRPDIKRGNISADEEDLIIRLHRLLGNRWSLIAGRLPGRTDNEIKNYWNTHLAKKPQHSLHSYLSTRKDDVRDSPLPKPTNTKLFGSPAVPPSTVGNHDMNLSNPDNFETCSAPVTWSYEDDCQQVISYLDFEMGDISVSGEDFHNLFSNLDEVQTEAENSIRTETLQDLRDTLENWSAGYVENDGFESSASLNGSLAGAEGRAIEDWLGNILD